jgi:ceramide glucosyltransferase
VLTSQLHLGWRLPILLVATAPFFYYLVAIVASLRFFARERKRTLPNFTPPISILKPVRGVDFTSYENFASFCRQDYPEYEILFAVADETDPAVPLINRLIAEFPDRSIRLYVGAEQIGSNRKINKLLRLLREARHEILALTDGDVRVGPNYLREVGAPFASDRAGINLTTGAVTSFYRSITQPNLAAELEAIGAASDFFAGVLVAASTEGIAFALGASIVTTKGWLAGIGGLEPIADLHSDDYELGFRIAKAGGRVLLAREAVWTTYPAQTARDFWNHQLRWARTVRLSRPVSYLGLIFTHGLAWASLAALIAPTISIAAAYFAAYLLLRWTMAYTVGIWGVRDDVLRRKLYLVPVYDAIHFFIFLASFASNRIVWRGEHFVMRRGQMVPVRSQRDSK